MVPGANLTPGEFAYHSKFEQTLNDVAAQLGAKLSEVRWTFSNNKTALQGSLFVDTEAQSEVRWLPKVSIHLELSEVRIMYTYWLSTLMRSQLDLMGARKVRTLTSRLTFGEHIGRTVEEVINEAPTYIEWALDEVEYFELDGQASDALDQALDREDPLEDIF